MRLLALCLVASTAYAQVEDRPPPLRLGGLPAFLFWPSQTCACTMPTDARGNIMQGATRATSATCSPLGIQTTGIADESLVTCGVNEPRLEAHSNGLIGYRQEMGNGGNRVLYSDAPDNAVWTKEGCAGACLPAVDAGVGPKLFSGGANSDFVSFAASSGASFSDFYQAWNTSVPAYAPVCSWYVKGALLPDAGVNTGTTDACSYDGASWSCTDCVYTSASWTRCFSKRVAGAATVRYCKLGNNSNQNGGVARAEANVYVACAMGEENTPGPGSCVPSTSAMVNRGADGPLYQTFDAGTVKEDDGLYSMGFVVSSLKTSGWTVEYAVAMTNLTNPYVSMYTTSGANVKCESFNASAVTATGSYIQEPVSQTVGCWNDGVNEQGWAGSTPFATPGAGSRGGASMNRLNLGTTSLGYEVSGVVGPLCFDKNPNRCRNIFP